MNAQDPHGRRNRGGIEETPYVPPIYDNDPETEVSKRWRVPVALVGLAGFIVGVFIWGSLAMAMLDGVQSFTDDSEATSNGNGTEAAPTVTSEASSIDCEALAAQETMSPGEQALFEEACEEPTEGEGGEEQAEGAEEPTEGESGEQQAEPQPQDSQGPPNRANCNQIRGTQYLSPEERTWFLANCVNR